MVRRIVLASELLLATQAAFGVGLQTACATELHTLRLIFRLP